MTKFQSVGLTLGPSSEINRANRLRVRPEAGALPRAGSADVSSNEKCQKIKTVNTTDNAEHAHNLRALRQHSVRMYRYFSDVQLVKGLKYHGGRREE